MSSKIQELKDKISPKALKVLKGTGYENDEEILIDLAELTEEHQIKASEYLTLSPIKIMKKFELSLKKIMKKYELMEKYPYKDKNQIKLQLSDDYMEKAQRVIQAERWRSIPDLARKLLENYLDSYVEIEQLEAIKNNIR